MIGVKVVALLIKCLRRAWYIYASDKTEYNPRVDEIPRVEQPLTGQRL